MIKKRRGALILGGFALIALFLLASALSELTFKPGQSFDLGLQQLQTMREMPSFLEGNVLVLFFRIIFTLALILLPISIIYMLISPERRKRFLADMLRMALFLTMFYLIIRSRSELIRTSEVITIQNLGEVSEEMGTQLPPLPDFTATPSSWLVYTISLVLALVVTAIVIGAAWAIWKRGQQEKSMLEALVQEAQDALESLQSGGDVKDAVLRCYFEMTRVLHEQRGIQRGRAMTTREFEERLIVEGLPGTPVRQLTRLFEAVRYGVEIPGKAEEQQAIMCLTAIIDAAGEASRPRTLTTDRGKLPPTRKAARNT